MADLRTAGTWRHLVEGVLWTGFAVMGLAVALAARAPEAVERPVLRPSPPAEQWIDLQPRRLDVPAGMDRETFEALLNLGGYLE